MKALVLIDLDNVLSDQPLGRELENFLRGAKPRLTGLLDRARASTCVVSMVFNTDTTVHRGLTFDALRAAGVDLASWLTDGEARLELGMVVTMPQTADVLLARMARETTTESAESYEFATLFSEDKGLAKSLWTEHFSTKGWYEVGRPDWQGASWCMPQGGQPILRKPLARAPAASLGSVPDISTSFTVSIDSGGLAAWAGQRHVDVEVGTELSRLANEVDRQPWLLSQIGATRSSLRGIQRLSLVAGTAPVTLRPISDKDQVVVRGHGSCPTQVSKASTACIGIGAANFKDDSATVASRISATVLATSNGPYLIASGALNVGAALQAFPVGACLGSQTVKVALSRRGSKLVAKVMHSGFEQPRAWWIRGQALASSGAASTEHIAENAAALLPHDVITIASPMRCPAGHTARLGLRSLLGPGTQVRVDGEIAQGTIGTAFHQSTSEAVAVFSPTSAIADGTSVTVDPIHTVARTGAVSAFPLALWSLPLVVPR